jgi:phosphoribosyl 1,2-cyclic phosphodiesterase
MAQHAAKLSFWGVRGSIPTVDRETWRYGGNTPCLDFCAPDGTRFILDCGTGLRAFGNHWQTAHGGEAGVGGQAGGGGETHGGGQALHAHIFVTHYHWDHIQGIPFFAPLYSAQNHFHFYSFRSKFLGPESLKHVMEAQMAHPYFPVDLSAMSAQREFTEVAGGEQWEINGTRITARWLNHPQGCLGFRIETSAGVIAYATDNEPGNAELDRSLRELARGADIYVADAQYTPEQLAGVRKGWGHSSWMEGVRVAKECGARNLVLFHHDPESSDKMIDGILREARQHFPSVWGAAEGMVMTLGKEQVDVLMPAARSGQRPGTHLRAHIYGYTEEGRAFEEETQLRDLSLHGALVYLEHAPRLQSELHVVMDAPGGGNGDDSMRFSGYVVRLEPGPEKDRTAVGIVFTE